MYYDIKVFNFINGFANQSTIVDVLGIFLAHYLAYILGLFLLFFLFWPKKNIVKNRAMVLGSITSALISIFVVKKIILLFFARPRPYVILPLTHKLIAASIAENLQAFPSGHAIVFFSLSSVIYNFNKKLGILFFVSSVLMGIARVFVGVHWPSDILAGAILGILVGTIINRIYLKNRDSMDNFIAIIFKSVDKVYDRF